MKNYPENLGELIPDYLDEIPGAKCREPQDALDKWFYAKDPVDTPQFYLRACNDRPSLLIHPPGYRSGTKI
jgi:hypothetical protein